MVNQEVEDVVGKLRRCRTSFYLLSFLSLFLGAFMGFFVSACIRESAYLPGAVFTFLALLFLSSIYIFTRENRVLSGIVAELHATNDELILRTIFSESYSLKGATVITLGPEWIRKRRWWPSYFLRGVDAVQYARQPSRIVKAVMLRKDDFCFYWIGTDIGRISAQFREIEGVAVITKTVG